MTSNLNPYATSPFTTPTNGTPLFSRPETPLLEVPLLDECRISDSTLDERDLTQVKEETPERSLMQRLFDKSCCCCCCCKDEKEIDSSEGESTPESEEDTDYVPPRVTLSFVDNRESPFLTPTRTPPYSTPGTPITNGNRPDATNLPSRIHGVPPSQEGIELIERFFG